jgi:CO/xanthine dehydrogenase Mo-binding subunit
VELVDGRARVRGAQEKALPLAQIVGLSHYVTSGPLCGRGSFIVSPHELHDTTVEGFLAPIHEAVGFGAAAVEVDVEPETGVVQVRRVVAVHDVGKAIFPQGVEGQIEGAALQGIGYALSEELALDGGRVRNTLLNDYLVPLSVDAPPIEAVIVEGYQPAGEPGAKGVGEHALLGIAPAIASAIEAAVGVRLTTLPLSPERVLAALQAEEG